MTLSELIEQLELTKRDHPESAAYRVEANGLEVFAVNIVRGEPPEFYVELDLYRTWAGGNP